MNKINFNHSYTIFSKIPALLSLDNKISPLYLYSWFTSTKKVDFGATNGKKHHVDCVVITPVKKSSKTSDIIKQTILNMNSKSPNLNNYDMNDFFPVNNTIYGGWISGRLNYSKPPDDKDKKDDNKDDKDKKNLSGGKYTQRKPCKRYRKSSRKMKKSIKKRNKITHKRVYKRKTKKH